jgi:hypothetical protein
MTKDPITISPDATIDEALADINFFHIGTLPVVSEGKLVGVVTKQDIKYRLKEPNQKVSDIMSTSVFSISPEEELSVATEKLKSLRINALIIVEEMKVVGILTRYNIYKKSLQKFSTCHYCYPRGDKKKKALSQCNYCKEWFCEEHFSPKKPMAAPLNSIAINEYLEWKKIGGHPCVSYYDSVRGEERILKEKLAQMPYPSYGGGPIKIEPTTPTKPEPTAPTTPEEIKGKKTKPIGLSYKIAGGLLIVLLTISIFYCCNTAIEINSRSSYLGAVNTNLNGVNNELNGVITKLNSNESVLQGLENRLNSVKNNLGNTNSNLNDVDSELAYLRTGGKYNLHDPTYTEVINFLARDSTDSNTYSLSSYTCAYFSKDVNNNAEKQGIRCAYVVLNFPSLGHAIVAFNTTDRGLVYFEPQYDVRADLMMGKRFYQCLQNRPGWNWDEPSYDDTIQGITCYW